MHDQVEDQDRQYSAERPGDEDAIDIVQCRAFGKMDEANLVRLGRAMDPRFDPRYSVCACDGDRIVGHILFWPLPFVFV